MKPNIRNYEVEGKLPLRVLKDPPASNDAHVLLALAIALIVLLIIIL